MDLFDKTNEEVTLSPSDISQSVSALKQTDMLYDIFLAMGSIAIVLHTIFFIFAALGKNQIFEYIFFLGYAILLVIIIYTARHVYKDLDTQFREKCEGEESSALKNDFIIESENRFYSISSFMYYYVKTYVLTLFNIVICCLLLYLFYSFLKINMAVKYNDTWVNTKFLELFNVPTFITPYVKWIYLGLSALFLGFIVIGTLVYSMAYFFGNAKLPGGDSLGGAIVIMLIAFLLFPGILYFNDKFTDWISDTIKKRKISTIDPVTQEKVIKYPILELYKEHVFKIVDFTNPEMIKHNIRIFLYGFIISMVFAFILLPKFDVERYCNLRMMKRQKGLDQDAERDYNYLHDVSQQYAARFKFGYFVMVSIVLFMHIWELTIRGIFKTIWTIFAYKNKTDIFQTNTDKYIYNQNITIQKSKDILLKAYNEASKRFQQLLKIQPLIIEEQIQNKDDPSQTQTIEKKISKIKDAGGTNNITDDQLTLSKTDCKLFDKERGKNETDDNEKNNKQNEENIFQDPYPPGITFYEIQNDLDKETIPHKYPFPLYRMKIEKTNEKFVDLTHESDLKIKGKIQLQDKQAQEIFEHLYKKDENANRLSAFLHTFHKINLIIQNVSAYFEKSVKQIEEKISSLPEDEEILKLWRHCFIEQMKMSKWIDMKFKSGKNYDDPDVLHSQENDANDQNKGTSDAVLKQMMDYHDQIMQSDKAIAEYI